MTSLCLKQQSYESNYFLSWAWRIQYFSPDQLVTDVRLLAEWPMFLPFKEEKEIEISYSHSQELPLTLVEFSPPFNINSDRNISKFYWIWKLFTFKLSEVTIINTTSFNVDSKKKRKIQLYHKGGNSTIGNLSSTFTESVRTLLPFIPASQWWEFKATRL